MNCIEPQILVGLLFIALLVGVVGTLLVTMWLDGRTSKEKGK